MSAASSSNAFLPRAWVRRNLEQSAVLWFLLGAAWVCLGPILWRGAWTTTLASVAARIAVVGALSLALYRWEKSHGETSFEVRADSEGVRFRAPGENKWLLWSQIARGEKQICWHQNRLRIQVRLLDENGQILAFWWRDFWEAEWPKKQFERLESAFEFYLKRPLENAAPVWETPLLDSALGEVALQPPRRIAIMGALSGFVLALPAFLAVSLGEFWMLIWPLFFAGLLVFWLCVQARWRIDGQGITRAQIGTHSTLKWREIQRVRFEPRLLRLHFEATIPLSLPLGIATNPAKVLDVVRAYCEKNEIPFEAAPLSQSKTGPHSKSGVSISKSD